MTGHSYQVTETHAMTVNDQLWTWIRARDGKPFTTDDAHAASTGTRATASTFICRLARAGILLQDGTVAVKWTKKPRKLYRLAVDYGPDTPRIEADGMVIERQQNFDTPRAVWATMRIHRTLGWSELFASVNSGRRANYSEHSVRYYLREVLVRGGYVIDSTPRLLTSQYLLVNDTGPRAPVRKQNAIWDANLGKVVGAIRGVSHV